MKIFETVIPAAANAASTDPNVGEQLPRL